MSRKKIQLGFTLIEIIIVVGFLITIVTLTVPFTIGMYESQITRSTTDEIFSSLKKAQSYSLYRRDNSEFGFIIIEADDVFVLFKGNNYDEFEGANESHPLYGVSASFAPANPANTIIFSKSTGEPDWVGLITLSRGSVTQYISVCDTGLIEFGNSCGIDE